MTLVGRLMGSSLAVSVMDVLPVPLSVLRSWMLRDNAAENRLDGWNRLRAPGEQARYRAVRAITESYAHDGFVLDVGCSQGILQEGFSYRRYLGIDSFPAVVAQAAQVKTDSRTAFVCADAATFEADEPPDAVVLNEVIYYLRDPVPAVLHHARRLAPGGVVIVSIYARAWSSRRLLRQLASRLELMETRRVESGQLAWTISVFRSS